MFTPSDPDEALQHHKQQHSSARLGCAPGRKTQTSGKQTSRRQADEQNIDREADRRLGERLVLLLCAPQEHRQGSAVVLFLEAGHHGLTFRKHRIRMRERSKESLTVSQDGQHAYAG